MVCLMGRYSSAELRKFRDTSRCSACVHYSGCALWLALLLMNDEFGPCGLDLIVPARCSFPGPLSQPARLLHPLAQHRSADTLALSTG